MKSDWFQQHWQPIPQTLRLLIITLLALGIFFRFANLDQKVYWYDEVFTSLRISGYTSAEVIQQLQNKSPVPIRRLEQYQYPNPEKTAFDTIYSLALEDSQHPPLYYLLTRWWVQAWGKSISAIRSLSAIFSLLLLPAVYWLCWELFQQPLVGWVAIALFAVSPFHIFLAQEAREYSLWALMITLSSALLLHALRTNKHHNWIAYAISLSLGFYTFPLTFFVAVSHGLYTFVVNQARITRPVLHYLGATTASFITFLPWAFIIFTQAETVEDSTNWLSKSINRSSLLKTWFINLSRFFIDFNSGVTDWLRNPLNYLIVAILGLVTYTIYFLIQKKAQPSYFLLLLLGTCSISFMMADLALGGRRSTIPRYLLPSYISIQIAVSYLLAFKLQISIPNSNFKKGWQFIFIGLTLCGLLSGIKMTNSAVWWPKGYSNSNLEISTLINQSKKPVLVTDDKLGNILSLSYSLSTQTQLYLIRQPKLHQLKAVDGDIFLLNPSEDLLEALGQQTGKNTKKIYQDPKARLKLWKLI